MELILQARAAGKTTRMVERVRISGGILWVFSHQEKLMICEQFDLPTEQVMSTQELLASGVLMGREKNVYVDNVDMIMQSLVPSNQIIAMTATKERG